jgi:hypothetical protein
MNFELKNVVSVGDVKSVDANNSLQWLNISVGVVGCPYADIITTQTVKYEFANSLTVQEAKDGITPFAEAWVVTNYPNT